MANAPSKLSLGQVTGTLEIITDTFAELQAVQAKAGRLQRMVEDARGVSQRLKLYVEGELGKLGHEFQMRSSGLETYFKNFEEAPVNTAMAAVNKLYNLGATGYEGLRMKMKDAPELLNALKEQYLPSVTRMQQFVEPTAAGVRNILQYLIQRSAPQGPARRAPRRAPA